MICHTCKDCPHTDAEVGGQIQPICRRELVHDWLMTDEEFFRRVDATGGWPVGYTCVSFYRDAGGDRYCKFTARPLMTGWWTTVATADDYYYWKISEEKKAEIVDQVRRQLIRQLK